MHRRAGQEPLGPRHADLLAWQLVLPETACFTHLTAVEVLGLWLPPVPAGTPTHVCLPKGENRPRRGQLRVSRLDVEVRPLVAAGVRVAPAAEALLACARDLGLLDLVVMLDSALRAGRCTTAEVERAAGPRRRGAPALREALAHADPRSESPWESLLRMFHLLCGSRPRARMEADAAIGRPHDPSRLEPWREVLKESLFSREGRAAFVRRCHGPISAPP